ncbi:type VI secretion system baseplate subunit TssF [Helicobacter sp. 14348-15]|uniref:type VI secretion system baseplate subunit TssF n=1 Tax=Helicobacter TaxID=209 RepID=UPI001F564F14|nr:MULTISPECIES: type VI secretion system baseplate subunit TssF [Helicobacter]MCI2236789.1 type VI secretion system baseplate subunit TssF [Helicobacter sp. CaF467b]MCL9821806.1 type VI secretion system baseplate subunit TssF [Helicobacter colisuis]
MNQDNLFYFQKELTYLYETRKLFIQKYPKLAPFLAHNSKDPDVERIIENLAVLTSKIHQEMDQNIPYIAESLINIIAPNYTSALPSLSMQEFQMDKKSKEKHIFIPKGTCVKSIPINKCECIFKTIYDVFLYPLSIEDAFLGSDRQYQTLNLNFKINENKDFNLCDLNLVRLNIYLGDDVYASSNLLLYIHFYLRELKIISLDTNQEFKLSIYNIKAMGLSPDESTLSYNELGFEAFSLLREYFFLPEKFNFIAITGLEVLKECLGKSFSIEFKFDKHLPKNCILRKELFSLGVTPIVNVFQKSAEPIINHHNRDGYRIFVDRSQLDSYEIINILQVKAHNSDTGRRILKSYNHFERFEFLKENKNEFYSIADKINSRGDTYKEISFFSTSSQTETITIEALCCNKNLPTLLNIGDIQTSDIKDVRTKNIKNPSPMRKYNADNLLWKLVSILSFNYQTMLNKTSFFNVLEAYSFLEDKENVETYKLLKESIVDIQGKSTYLVDGYITKKGILTIFYIKDSNFYSLGEVYRLGLILSKFLSSFASINSFCELKIRCLDSKETLYYSANFGKKPIL